ncbi:aminoglycoside phosphotransferase (APT) family kinase protein [Paenibacillus phyllosphaerae]|uniref:Aminoglycoside phosphotransferase (APT) family kinase protein n=1 Tax=Paenibacillus phyllosphaerae TaxID=274593 RepID=A0A7W5B4Q7_9BACL|nr:aminoglycoside phosphotransferase family protein [Paenibacillus phyllosphaerae]MBB3114380.1 aminoglycoside phosphotransferase (APT) family kinase protein [Paenibacillus phyllosphaerae]
MNLTVIAAELFAAGILPPGELVISPLAGGTSSMVYRMKCGDADPLVLKLNEPRTIAAEAEYLDRYRHLPLLPTFQYVNPEHRFLVYSYIDGNSNYVPGSKLELMNSLARDIIAKYDQVPWTGGKFPTWHDYLIAEIEDSRRSSGTLFTASEHRMIYTMAEKKERVTGPFCKLHGDFGVHNFIFDEGKLKGVIDPIPLTGQPVYELAFAFVSSPDELEPDIIASVVRQKDWPFTKDLHTVYEDILIALYNRIIRCTHHHPKDLSAYMEAWKDWKLFVNSKS